MRYPPARRLDLVEELHGFRVADPYRWLEDAESDETEAWCKAQDELLAEWMDGRSERAVVRDRLAYFLSQGGDEEASLFIMDVAGGETVEGPIDRTRYCPLAWLPGGDTYYYGRRLLVGGAAGTAPRNDLYIADLAGDAALRPIQEGVDAETDGRVGTDGRLYLHTNLDAPRFRIAVADPADPEPAAWRDLVPESGDVLDGFALTDDAVVVASSRHAVGRVAVHDRRTGAVRAGIDLPGPGS